jgi:hypothetical protein
MLGKTVDATLAEDLSPDDRVTFGQLADAIIDRYDLAEDRHLVRFTEAGWTIQHPVAERMVGLLLDCTVHLDNARLLVEPPDSGLGDYWLTAGALEPVWEAS